MWKAAHSMKGASSNLGILRYCAQAGPWPIAPEAGHGLVANSPFSGVGLWGGRSEAKNSGCT